MSKRPWQPGDLTWRAWFLQDAPFTVIGLQLALLFRLLPTPWDARVTLAMMGVMSWAWGTMRLWDKWKESR